MEGTGLSPHLPRAVSKAERGNQVGKAPESHHWACALGPWEPVRGWASDPFLCPEGAGSPPLEILVT